MASTVAVLLLLSAGLLTVTAGFGDDCISYTSKYKVNVPSLSCSGNFLSMHCCGDCDVRYCCMFDEKKISTAEQWACALSQKEDVLIIVLVVVGVVVTCVVFLICCCCPSCIMYKMCRAPRPVAGAHVTTVVNTQSVQQPLVMQPLVMQPAQYPAYKPEPTQPGYSAQPMQTGPHQGPPSSYNMTANPGYPSVQAPYDGSQAMYPMMPPAQPGAYPPPLSFEQPAYNPTYMQPPKTGY